MPQGNQQALILDAGKWNVATYIWNESQTDAVLAKSASRQRIEYIDAEGKSRSINYQVPALNECATCHNASSRVVPIGPKLCNLNVMVKRNGNEVNQLQAMMNEGLLESFDHSRITKMADWQDNSAQFDKRVRAYLDVNCAHCHNPAGFASGQKLNLHYNIPLEQTGIAMKSQTIINKIRSGQMPKPGTTVVDEKALALIMLTNPVHLAIFESTDEKAETMQHKMFTSVLKLPACNIFVAKENGRIVGVMNYYKKGCCQIGPLQTLTMLPGLSVILKAKLSRVLKWKSNWGSHDPKADHFHFGPLAVLPSMQGKDIGSALLTQFCVLADAEGIGSWLETDKEENLPLYEKFGFKVRESDILFGVKNWFMWRDATSQHSMV